LARRASEEKDGESNKSKKRAKEELGAKSNNQWERRTERKKGTVVNRATDGCNSEKRQTRVCMGYTGPAGWGSESKTETDNGKCRLGSFKKLLPLRIGAGTFTEKNKGGDKYGTLQTMITVFSSVELEGRWGKVWRDASSGRGSRDICKGGKD